MATVLEIGNAAAQIVGLPTQTNLVGSSNQNAIRILKAVKDAAGKDAFRDADWETLTREHTFTTDASTEYALPTYYDRIISGTIWDRTNYDRLIGPMTATEWQKHKSGLVSLSGINKLFRISSDTSGNKQIQIYPSSDIGSEIAFEYIDSRHVKSSGGDLQTSVLADSDEFLFSSDVVEAGAAWRLLRMLGLSYQDEKAEYARLLSEYRSNDAGAPVLNMQLRSVFTGRNPHVPDSGFGA